MRKLSIQKEIERKGKVICTCHGRRSRIVQLPAHASGTKSSLAGSQPHLAPLCTLKDTHVAHLPGLFQRIPYWKVLYFLSNFLSGNLPNLFGRACLAAGGMRSPGGWPPSPLPAAAAPHGRRENAFRFVLLIFSRLSIFFIFNSIPFFVSFLLEFFKKQTVTSYHLMQMMRDSVFLNNSRRRNPMEGSRNKKMELNLK